MVESTLPTTSVCPAETGNIALAAQCVRVQLSKLSYGDAVEACGAQLGLVTPPLDNIQSTILGYVIVIQFLYCKIFVK